MENSILMPTVSSASSPASSPGAPASSPASAERSSQKPSLKSRLLPDALLEGQAGQQPQQPRVVKVKKEDLQAFIQMMSEFQEIMESKA